MTLLQFKIKSGPLLLSPDMISDIKSLGLSMRAPGRELSIETLSELIGLVKRHVSLVVSELSDFQLAVLEIPSDRSWLPYPDQRDIASCRFRDVDG